MSDPPDNLLLIYLRRIDERTARMEDRLTTMERRMGLRDQDVAIDRMSIVDLDSRVTRIERRLDLRESS